MLLAYHQAWVNYRYNCNCNSTVINYFATKCSYISIANRSGAIKFLKCFRKEIGIKNTMSIGVEANNLFVIKRCCETVWFELIYAILSKCSLVFPPYSLTYISRVMPMKDRGYILYATAYSLENDRSCDVPVCCTFMAIKYMITANRRI